MLWQEAEIVRERVNGRIATEATLIHSVIATVMSTERSAPARLVKIIDGVANGR